MDQPVNQRRTVAPDNHQPAVRAKNARHLVQHAFDSLQLVLLRELHVQDKVRRAVREWQVEGITADRIEPVPSCLPARCRVEVHADNASPDPRLGTYEQYFGQF